MANLAVRVSNMESVLSTTSLCVFVALRDGIARRLFRRVGPALASTLLAALGPFAGSVRRENEEVNMKQLVWIAALVWIVPVEAQQVTRRANINGNAVDGKCTIEVEVDGAADVEVRAIRAGCGICRASRRCGAASNATGSCRPTRRTSDSGESTVEAKCGCYRIPASAPAE